MKKVVIRAALGAALSFAFCVGALAAELLVPVGKVVGLQIAQGSVTVVAFDEDLGDGARSAGLKV